MNLGIATHQARAYHVATPVYSGPLDLLLQLIESAELDITRLALAQVTDQYLEHLHKLENLAAEEVSAFIVIASKLLQIKSEALLPRPPHREEGEEDPAEALARQLLEYKRYKEIANLLGQREAAGLRTYLRLAPPPKIEASLDLSGLSLTDVVAIARSVFARQMDQKTLSTVVSAPRVTIREKLAWITGYLRAHGRATFRSLLHARPTQLDIVVTFLAMLELVKSHWVSAQQEKLFGEILVERSGEWDDDDSFELEFGE